MGLLKKVKDKTEASVKKVGKEGAKLGKKGLEGTEKVAKKGAEATRRLLRKQRRLLKAYSPTLIIFL